MTREIDVQDFLSLEEALALNREQMRQLYREYINSGKGTLQRLLNVDQEYVQAKGVYVYDVKGREYLDFFGGFGALSFGHNPPQVHEALARVQEAPNLLQTSISKLTAACARNLCFLTPGDLKRSFFCNSGAEAVEAALKLARKATKRTGLLYTEGGYHGKTFGALSVTGKKKYQEPFQPLLPDTHAIPYGELDPLKKKIEEVEAAAFIIEPIQGEAGIILPREGYLKEVEALCREKGVLLIMDEIQTGLGRTGALFGCDHEGVEPDIMVLSKALGGGVMPMGVCISTDAVWKKAYGSIEDCLLHTSTFGENTLASAAALGAMEILLTGDLVKEVATKGAYFLEGLLSLKEEYPLIKEVRGRGLLIGVEFVEAKKGLMDTLSRGLVGKLSQEYLAALVVGDLLNNHRIITVYTLNNPHVMRLEPPLIVDYVELDRVLKALDETLHRNRGLFSVAFSGARSAVRSFFKD